MFLIPSILFKKRQDHERILRFLRRDFVLPLAGVVRAGFPLSLGEELPEDMSIDEYLVTKPEASFLLRVSRDSMTGEGIMPGDLVIVEKGRDPRTGDVVVAQLDGEWTMRYFTRTKSGTVVLESANPKHPPIHARGELKIAGIVSAVVRKYHL
jgi:SOS-response transcriptional repressor LexA